MKDACSRRELAAVAAALAGLSEAARAKNRITPASEQDGDTTIAAGPGRSAFPSLREFGAAGDGITDDAGAIDRAIAAAGSGTLRFPHAKYAVSGITTGQASKIDGAGSVLVPTGNNQTVLTGGSTLPLETGSFTVWRDLTIDGTGSSGITGISGAARAGDGHTAYLGAQTILENLYVRNCDIGFDLGATQFLRTYNLSAYAGRVGLLIGNDSVGGGANSHDHFQPHLVGNAVGLLVDGTHYIPVLALNFYNPQWLSNSVCGAAFFHVGHATVYGGAPEVNAGGAPAITVNGLTVKRSSVYLNKSNVQFENCYIGETATPCFLIENNSVLHLHNVAGYGNVMGRLVEADPTSVVELSGHCNCAGTIENVTAWPDSISLDAGQATFSGKPVLAIDPKLEPLYADQAPVRLAASVFVPPRIAFVEDEQLGYCAEVVFATSRGEPSGANAVHVDVNGTPADGLTIVSVLLKSATDCGMEISLSNSTDGFHLSGATVALRAGKVTRVVMVRPHVSAGTDTIWFAPRDARGSALRIANLQLYVGPLGDAGAAADINRILHDGAFWPGVTRATTAVLQNAAESVNMMGKYPGKSVWVVDAGREVFAAGPKPTDPWNDASARRLYPT
jgi:hypothetical protein